MHSYLTHSRAYLVRMERESVVELAEGIKTFFLEQTQSELFKVIHNATCGK